MKNIAIGVIGTYIMKSMRHFFYFLILLSLIFLNGLPVQAEGMVQSAYTAKILELNRIRPGHNPAFTLGKDKLTARILDKNQITLGKVEDIVLTPDGKFQTLLTTVEITGFREKIAFDVAGYVVDPTPDTFTINMQKKQVQQSMEKLKAEAILPYNPYGPFNLTSLQNAFIYRPDGSLLAKAKDVIINDHIGQIVALLVIMADGDHRGATLAIPFEAAAAKHVRSNAALTLSAEQTQIIQSMAIKR